MHVGPSPAPVEPPSTASAKRPIPVAQPAAEAQDALPGLERDLRQPLRSRPEAKHAPTPAPATPRPARPAWSAEPERTLELDSAPKSSPAAPRLETAPFRPGEQPDTSAVATHAPAPPTPPASAPAVPDRAHERARRLARVLVSDILVYNQEARDRGLREGNLIAVLGPEISKAWELYKSKVSPEVAASTSYFKDALNEILAGGEEIF